MEHQKPRLNPISRCIWLYPKTTQARKSLHQCTLSHVEECRKCWREPSRLTARAIYQWATKVRHWESHWLAPSWMRNTKSNHKAGANRTSLRSDKLLAKPGIADRRWRLACERAAIARVQSYPCLTQWSTAPPRNPSDHRWVEEATPSASAKHLPLQGRCRWTMWEPPRGRIFTLKQLSTAQLRCVL